MGHCSYVHPPHASDTPGEVLREDFLQPLRLSASSLARVLGVSPSRITAIVRQQRRVSANTAQRLSHCFGGDAQSWLNLQRAYDWRVGVGNVRDSGGR